MDAKGIQMWNKKERKSHVQNEQNKQIIAITL